MHSGSGLFQNLAINPIFFECDDHGNQRSNPPGSTRVRAPWAAATRCSRSASVVLSKTEAIASRTCRMIIRVPHVSMSEHSWQGEKAVSLAHGNGAKGPSIIRMTDPSVMVEGGRLR